MNAYKVLGMSNHHIFGNHDLRGYRTKASLIKLSVVIDLILTKGRAKLNTLSILLFERFHSRAEGFGTHDVREEDKGPL